MAILCDSEIRAALRNRHLIIEPLPQAESIGTSAVDLTLGHEFKRWTKPPGGVAMVVDPSAADFNFSTVAKAYLEEIPPNADGSITLSPHEFALGITAEKVQFPAETRLAARVEGRSTLARLGVGVHITAPTIHAGFRGQITLEITNQGVLPIKLKPGLKVCQLIIEQVFGTPATEMTGAFQDQGAVAGGPL
jgi:dCTP deaminase